MIDRPQLAELARTHRLVPLTRTLFADAETPVGVYRKLARRRPGPLLLEAGQARAAIFRRESAEPGASFSRWSFVGVSALATLTVEDGQARWLGSPPPGLPDDGDPLGVVATARGAGHGPRVPGPARLTVV